jgi:Common central domain of tyrosinase
MPSPLIDRLARRFATSGTRRQMLVKGGKGTVAGLRTAVAARSFGTSLFGSRLALTYQGAPYTRPNVHSPEANLESYALAVKNMKALEANEPKSWDYQANIHGTLLPQSQWRDLFYTCEHHTDYFWPWHRIYLYWFEQIIRDQSGNSDFALPYWDYSDPTQQYLPEPFRKTDNPLYVNRRSTDANFRDASSLPIDDPMFNYCNGLAQPSFGLIPETGASERLESDIHDPIHGWIGGGTFLEPGLMSQVGTSAQDPVFYLHHANMDRLWESWKAITLDGASHTDPRDLSWRDSAYEFFDDTGTKLNPPWIVKEVLDTTAMELGYVYERLADNAWFEANCGYLRPLPTPPPAAPPGTPVAALEIGRTAPEGRIEIGPEPVEVPVLLAPPEAGGTPQAFSGRPRVLTLDGIEGTGVPAVSVQVYINLPEGVQPDFRSPYYVGTLGLFTVQPWDANSPHAGHGAAQSFDISRNIAALEATGEWTGELKVTFIPVDLNFSARTEAPGTPEAGVGTPEAKPGPWATVESVSVTTE